jgi:hypothetical protein
MEYLYMEDPKIIKKLIWNKFKKKKLIEINKINIKFHKETKILGNLSRAKQNRSWIN